MMKTLKGEVIHAIDVDDSDGNDKEVLSSQSEGHSQVEREGGTQEANSNDDDGAEKQPDHPSRFVETLSRVLVCWEDERQRESFYGIGIYVCSFADGVGRSFTLRQTKAYKE